MEGAAAVVDSQNVISDKENQSANEKMVYDREEYSKKEFWNDRFKEQKG